MTVMCDKGCGIRINFKLGLRDENGFRIPYEERTGLPHDCDNTYPFPCNTCGNLIYQDKRVLSRMSNKRIPLNFGSDDFHYCKGEKA